MSKKSDKAAKASASKIGRLDRKAFLKTFLPLVCMINAAAMLGLAATFWQTPDETGFWSPVLPAWCGWLAATLLCMVAPLWLVSVRHKFMARLHDVGSTVFFVCVAEVVGCFMLFAFLVYAISVNNGVDFEDEGYAWISTTYLWSCICAALCGVVLVVLSLLDGVPGTNAYGRAKGCKNEPFTGTCWGGIIEDMLKLMLVMGGLGFLCNLLMKPFESTTATDSLVSLVKKGSVKDADFDKELDAMVEAKDPRLTEADEQGRTLLMLAICTGIDDPAQGAAKDLERIYYVRKLLKAGVDAAATDEAGRTALHYAAQYGMTYCCLTLIKEGKLDVAAKDNDGHTAMELAALNSHNATARALMQSDKSSKAEKPANPLVQYIAAGKVTDEPFAKELSEGLAKGKKNGTDFINTRDLTGRTPLMLAVYAHFNNPVKSEAKDLERLYYLRQLLATEGIDANAKDDDGFTALHWASWSGMPYCSFVLVNEGRLDINAQDTNGYTPLMLAALRGNANVVRILMQLGADTTLKNRDGYTALDLVTSAKDSYSHRDDWKYTLVYSKERQADYAETLDLLSHPEHVLSIATMDAEIEKVKSAAEQQQAKAEAEKAAAEQEEAAKAAAQQAVLDAKGEVENALKEIKTLADQASADKAAAEQALKAAQQAQESAEQAQKAVEKALTDAQVVAAKAADDKAAAKQAQEAAEKTLTDAQVVAAKAADDKAAAQLAQEAAQQALTDAQTIAAKAADDKAAAEKALKEAQEAAQPAASANEESAPAAE